MQVQRRYSRAPIKEAIIDLRVVLPDGFPLEKLRDIHFSIRDNFPIVEPFFQGIGAITYQPGSAFKVDTSEEQTGFWFRSEDNLQTLQATLGGFTFNRLAPYNSWEEFSNNARNLWEIYKEICKPIHITRAAVRYINQINIPVSELMDLKDYLSTVPEVSPRLPQKALQTFFMQLQIPQQDLDCMLVINEAITPPTNPETVAVILDLDLFRHRIWESNDEDIWRFLERLRHRKNEVFEASITDRTRELIK